MSELVTTIIRQVQDTDYEILARFFEENDRVEITKHFHPFKLNAQTALGIACTNHLDRYYIAILDGHAIGLCMLRGWDNGFDIPSFGLLVDYRHYGLGIGKCLTEFAIAEARNLGCDNLRLAVYASNTRALHLYLSMGFRETKHESVCVGASSDVKIEMVKSLK